MAILNVGPEHYILQQNRINFTKWWPYWMLDWNTIYYNKIELISLSGGHIGCWIGTQYILQQNRSNFTRWWPY